MAELNRPTFELFEELRESGVDTGLSRPVALARASRHYLGDWFTHADELPGLIRDPWVGGRPLLPDTLPVIDRLPGHGNAFVSTGHDMLGVTLGPASGRAMADFIRTGHRPEVLAPFGFDRSP